MNYSYVVDSLRFFAVLSVVLNHYFKGIFSFGFLGVDVFFVISGYLIIGNIIDNKKYIDFDAVSFLKRRFLRLMPAFIFTVVLIYVFSYIFLWDEQFKFVLKSLLTSFFYSTNVFFSYTIDYFTPNFEFIPTIHLWSLALEEQFYLLCALIFFCFKPKNILIYIIIITIISFLIFVLYFDNQGSYYLLQYRIWEFCIGGLVSKLPFKYFKFKYNSYFFIISFILLLLLLFHPFDYYLQYQKIYVFLSVLFTVIILSCKNEFIESNFSIYSLFYNIGKSSYSVYLVHQPLLLVKSVLFPGLFLFNIIFIFASFLLGFLSYKYIEKITNYSWFKLWHLSFFTAFVFLTIFLHLIFMNDNPVQKPINLDCEFTNNNICSFYNGENFQSKKILLLGDSHSLVLSNVLTDVLSDVPIDFVYANGCLPFTSISRSDHKSKYCSDFDSFLHENLEYYDVIISVNRWSHYFFGSYGGKDKAGYQSNSNIIFKNHVNGLNKFSKDIIFLEQVPELTIHPYVFDKSIFGTLKLKYDIHMQLKSSYIDYFDGYRSFNLDSAFCDDEYCYSHDSKNNPYYFDNNHLNFYGSNKLKPLLSNILTKGE